MSKAVGGHVSDIRGNAKWDAIKFVAEKHEKWLPYLLWGWGLLSAAVYATAQKIRGIPIDWLIIGLLAILSVLPMVVAFVFSKLRGGQTALEPQQASRPDADGATTQETSQTEAKPNVVFLRNDTTPVYTSDDGKIEEYENKPRTATWRTNHPGYFAIVALFHNQPTSSHKLTRTGKVSAQLTYQLPGETPFIVPRGLWYPEHSTVVDFGINDYHGLIIATVHDRKILCATQGESASFTDLDTDEVVVKVLITSESDASVIKESEFKIKLTREPEFKIKVSELPEAAHDNAAEVQEPPQSMNELIRAAARDIEKVPCGMGWLHAIAEHDRTNIHSAVQVRGISLRNLMDDGIPKLEFVFSVYNKSVHHISIEWKDGYIRFGREEKLRKNNLELKENHVVDCPPRRSAFFTLEQTLLDSEVRFITSQFDDKEFWFDELVVMINGGSLSTDVVPQRLKIEGQVSLKHQGWRNYND